MIRDIDENLISPEKLLHANDMVRLGCNDCSGCCDCCRDRAERITLDKWDMDRLKEGLQKSFDDLLALGSIEITLVNNILLPVLGKKPDKDECIFLNDEGRCTIHAFRPGICRMFPLARIYHDDGSFSYFLQEGECPHLSGVKIKVSKWLGVGNTVRYEQEVRSYHDRLKELRKKCFLATTHEDIVKLQTKFLEENFRGDNSSILC